MLRPNGKRLIVVTGAKANAAGHLRLRDFHGTIALLVNCGAGKTITTLCPGQPIACPSLHSRHAVAIAILGKQRLIIAAILNPCHLVIISSLRQRSEEHTSELQSLMR